MIRNDKRLFLRTPISARGEQDQLLLDAYLAAYALREAALDACSLLPADRASEINRLCDDLGNKLAAVFALALAATKNKGTAAWLP